MFASHDGTIQDAHPTNNIPVSEGPMRLIIVIVAATSLYAPARLFAAGANEHTPEASSRVFIIPKHGELNLNVPADWNYSVRYPRAGLPPTIEFTAGPGKKF